MINARKINATNKVILNLHKCASAQSIVIVTKIVQFIRRRKLADHTVQQ